MQRSAASDLGLHCLPVSHKKDARLKWVNMNLLCWMKNGVDHIHQKPADLDLHCLK